MPDDTPRPPAVLWVPSDRVWIDPPLVGRNLYVQTDDYVIDPAKPTLIAPADPARWAVGFSFAPPPLTGAVVGPWGDLDPGTGVSVPSPGLLWFYLTKYGPLVMGPWYGVGGADSVVRVTQILRG